MLYSELVIVLVVKLIENSVGSLFVLSYDEEVVNITGIEGNVQVCSDCLSFKIVHHQYAAKSASHCETFHLLKLLAVESEAPVTCNSISFNYFQKDAKKNLFPHFRSAVPQSQMLAFVSF